MKCWGLSLGGYLPGAIKAKTPLKFGERICRRAFWRELLDAGGYLKTDDIEKDEEQTQREINTYFSGRDFYSRHVAATNIISIFNRFSERTLIYQKSKDETLQRMLKMYLFCKESHQQDKIETVDFSLLQQRAFEKISGFEGSKDCVVILEILVLLATCSSLPFYF